MDSTYPLVPIANFLACMLVLLSLSRAMFHLGNIGICSFAIWVAVESLTGAINFSIWSNNTNDVAPIWCDITTHLNVGSLLAIPASSFVIIRRLSIAISHGDDVIRRKKRLHALFDLFFCVGCPITLMILYYIVQGARYQIVEVIGCGTSVGDFAFGGVLLDAPPILFPLASLIFYSPTLIIAYFKHNRDLNGALASQTTINRPGFIRLLALGLLDILFTLPITIVDLVEGLLQAGVTGFYPGWATVHENFNTIYTVTEEQWRSAGFWFNFTIRFDQWINPVFAVVFFLLFGLTEQKRAWYKGVIRKVVEPFGFKPRLDPEVSVTMFGTGPVVNSGASYSAQMATTGNQLSVISNTSDDNNPFNNAPETEKADGTITKRVIPDGDLD